MSEEKELPLTESGGTDELKQWLKKHEHKDEHGHENHEFEYYVRRKNPITGEMESKRVDSYYDFRNGDFWDLWILGHIAHTFDELQLVERERKYLDAKERASSI